MSVVIASLGMDHQGWLFWIAAAAITAGLSLLVATVAVQARNTVQRWPRKGTGRRRSLESQARRPVSRRTVVQEYARAKLHAATRRWQRSSPTITPPEPKLARPAVPTAPEPPFHGPALTALLGRLRHASDCLERLTADLGAQEPAWTDSPLKGEGTGVEYVFKASRL